MTTRGSARYRLIAVFVWVCILQGPARAPAERLAATVANDAGEPVPNAVVYATRMDAAPEETVAVEPAVVDQIGKEYVPFVTPIRAGTQVLFPNHDQIRHHVYSFSEAKIFEIPLYKGVPPKPILFDRPGEVVLGCNIHDWMRAYVFVLETPYYATTSLDGKAVLELPAGEYRVEVWHPELAGEADARVQDIAVGTTAGSTLRFKIERKRVWRPRRAPLRDDDY